MSKLQIKTLQTILKQRADNCVALTYSLDLPFFEYMLFEPLYNGGCRNVTLICDPGQYEAALDDVPALKHLGQRYLCLPSSITKAAFHPKLILLTSNEAGLLLVGSGNVSRSGLTHNQEVWTRFLYTNSSHDKFERAAFRWAFNYLGRVSEAQQDPMLQQRLDQIWQTTGWLRHDPAPHEDDGHWLFHNLDRPILDQLVDQWSLKDGSPVREVVVISPYFDRRSLAFESLLDRLQPERITLTTEPEAPGLNPDAVHRLLDNAGISLSSQRLELGSRRLHAKLLALRTKRGSWVLTGSPNFSRPAMLQSVRDGNAELAVLRYEPDPTYLELLMRPISEKAVPMALDWSPNPEEPNLAPDEERSTYRLLRAEVTGTALSIVVEPAIPDHARLRIELTGQEVSSFEVDEWERNDGPIVLELPENVRNLVSTPASVKLTIEASDTWESSTRTVVNNTAALQTNNRPVRRQERASVPERLVAEEFEQDIKLLSRLQNLLAMNPHQLRGRRGISKQTVEELHREDVMAVSEEDYDPEAMIAGERLQRIEVRTGADLYVDFYDRAFYEDVLAAARAAVYRPGVEATATLSECRENGSLPSDDPRSPASAGRIQNKKDAAKKVTGSFARLVTGFERGMQDNEYLVLVPSTYIQELFFVLTTYLRSLWRQELVDDKSFLKLSERLFTAFLGDERKSAGWSAVSDASTEERLIQNNHLSRYREQAWLHLYLLADKSLVEAEERLPYIARLMRRCTQELAPPALLSELPADTFATMWRNSFSHDRSVPELDAVVNDLLEYSEWYSEETLRQELALALAAKVTIVRRDFLGLRSVPMMRVKSAWSSDHMDIYWRVFCAFCRWPEWKINARLTVENSNPTPSMGSATPLELFYRKTVQSLKVWAKPSDRTSPIRKEIKVASLQELCNKPTFNEAILSGEKRRP